VLRVDHGVIQTILAESRRKSTQECCGLLAGREGVITHASPAENVAADPTRNYELAPKQIVQLLREFRAQGLEFLGIYHSHPTGENVPSPRDIELAYYSEATYFLLSPQPGAAKPVRAFSIRDGSVTELEIQLVP